VHLAYGHVVWSRVRRSSAEREELQGGPRARCAMRLRLAPGRNHDDCPFKPVSELVLKAFARRKLRIAFLRAARNTVDSPYLTYCACRACGDHASCCCRFNPWPRDLCE